MKTMRTQTISPWRSLKTRVTLLTLGVFVLAIWALSFYASRMLKEDMQRLLSEQQFSTATQIASEIDQQLNDRIKILETLAVAAAAAMQKGPASLQGFLDQTWGLDTAFNAGIVAVGSDGVSIADLPRSMGRVGLNLMDREHIIGALRDGKTSIGKPVMGRRMLGPIIVLAVPVRGTDGTIIGALSGLTDLEKPNFLDSVANSKYGKTGGFLLVASKYRLVVTATDKRRMMASTPAPGVTPLIDRFLAGYEGSAVFMDPLGINVLVSAKHIPVANWLVVASLPTAEAFSPIEDLMHHMLLATLLLTLLTGALTWWMLQRQLAPVLKTANRLTLLATSDLPVKPLHVARQDEIGAMVGGFNHLLEILGQRETALTESEFRWKFAIEGAGDGLWDWDVPNSTVYFSPRWKEMLGFNPDEIGDSLDEWSKRVHPDDLARVMTDVQAHLDGLTPIFLNEHRVRCKDGSWKWILDRGLVVSRDAQGMPLRVIGTHSDITEHHQAEAARNALQEQIRQLAFIDPLTQLPNRRLLDDRLAHALAASKRSALYGALMFLDLDNFKPLNDTHGHGMGDLLLVEVARRLTAFVRETDTVARVGGDEFVVLLTELHSDRAISEGQAAAVAEKIRSALAEPYLLTVTPPGNPLTTVEHRCSASIGVVLFGNHLASQGDLMKWADIAMYEAKDAGRNAVRIYRKHLPRAGVTVV